MSKTRIIIRVLLLLVLVGVCWVAYQAWLRTQPGYYRERANAELEAGEAAAAAGDTETAKTRLDAARLQLQNLLAREPDDAEAHAQLAQVLLKQAQAEGKPATLAAQPAALAQVETAAKLAPQDIGLQKSLLAAYLRQRDYNRAAPVATRVVEAEPEHAGALFVLAWKATRNRNKSAEKWLEQLAQVPNPRALQTLALANDYYAAVGPPEKQQQTYDTICRIAANLTAQNLADLTPDDRELLPKLLATAVAQAPDVATAHLRCELALSACEKLAAADNSDGKDSNRKDSNRKDSDIEDWATTATNVFLALARHQPPADDTEARDNQRALLIRAEGLRARAIAAGKASPMIYQQSVATSLVLGKVDEALATARQGLAAGETLEEDRQAELVPLHEFAARCLLLKGQLRDAGPHIEALLADKESAGRGHLYAGAIASAEGRHAKALTHYQQAERGLGQILLVRMGLASAYRALGRWAEALPILVSLQQAVPAGDAEQAALAGQLQINPSSVNLAIMQARLALGQWEAAQPNLEALQGTSLEPRAALLAVAYQWSRGDRAAARRRLEEARRNHPDDVTLLGTQATLWLREGKADNAETLLQEAAVAAADSLPHQLLLAKWYVARDNEAAFTELVNRLKTQFPESRAPALMQAQYVLRKGDGEKALQLAADLSASPATQRLGKLVAALAQLNLKNLPEAEAQLASVNEEGQNGALNILEAEVALAQGKFEDAVSSLIGTLDVTQFRARTSLDLLRAIVLLADKEGAEKAAVQVAPLLEQYPDDPLLWLVQADLLFKQQKTAEGMQALDRMEQLTPNSPNGPYIRASILTQLGQLSAAKKEITKALKREEKHVPSLVLLARLQSAENDNKAALETCRTALRINAQLWQLYLIQAECLRRLERPDQAVRVLQTVLKEQPKFLQAYLSLAANYAAAGQEEAALRVIRTGFEFLPDNNILALTEIQFLCGLERLDEAEQVAEKLAGTSPEATIVLAVSRTFAGQNQLSRAEAWSRRALDAVDKDDNALLRGQIEGQLAEVIYAQVTRSGDTGRLDEVCNHLRAAAKANPQDLQVANNLAWILAVDRGQIQEAVELLDQRFGEVPVGRLPVEVLDTLAEVYRRSGNVVKARQIVESALQIAPGNAILRFHRGMILAEQGEPVLAALDLQSAIDAGLSSEREAAARAKLDVVRPVEDDRVEDASDTDPPQGQ